jgi:LAO/AO transport system kinase
VNGLLDRFRRGDRQALARLLTHVENETPLADEAMREISSMAGAAHIIGLTGPPGAGKSTLANELVREARRINKTISVLAIDPTSPISGGATLGDRIRMLDMQSDEGVYLRSMASREQIGGLSLAAFGATMMLDAFGFDIVVIETVGAGQDEVDIARLADSVIVVQNPGMGDSVQAVKAGILEIADLLVVNKADQPGADEAVRTLREHVRTSGSPEWRVPVIPVVARTGDGVSELLTEMERHRVITHSGDEGVENRRLQRLRYHARLLAIRELARFIDRLELDPQDSRDPHSFADQLTGAFAKARCKRSKSARA